MPDIASLGFRTDLMVLGLGGSEIERHERHVVVRTPANPTFWWGNFVLFADPVGTGDVARRLEVFADAFPGARHVAWGIDTVDGTIGAEVELLEAGFEATRDTVLAATALRAPDRAVEAALRPLSGDDDWRRLLELRIACLPDDEHYSEPFVRAHVTGSRALCDRGLATWFGAFDRGTLRAALGIVTDGGGLARFQMVETHPDARRRGLARALLHRAGSAALDAGAETLVIVADPAYHAIDLYRSVGFADRETKVELTRRPPTGARDAA
ncbi:MAG TPA: GNAT family N-acetyltransferase [Gaiella sp.]|nr:GNAT family N-acetyltransferase [Gaiella sp.]